MYVKDYAEYVAMLERAADAAARVIVRTARVHVHRLNPARPSALLLAPHPDDECIMAAPALHLARRHGFNVIACAVTLGSDARLRPARAREFARACAVLGFGRLIATRTGLSGLGPGLAHRRPAHWLRCVSAIRRILERVRPEIVLCPHGNDWHPVHVATYRLLLGALARMPRVYQPTVILTEYWCPLRNPNLLLEADSETVTRMLHALAQHRSQLTRNPYHLLLPAWFMDNVRRGAELVGGPGAGHPGFKFGVLLRVLEWRAGRMRAVPVRQPIVLATDGLPFVRA